MMDAHESACVDVVVAVFNGERFICEAIQSILAQTIAPKKILVVDDGSVDDTYSIASSFKPVRVLQHPDQQNHGQAASLKLGLQECTSRYVAFLDYDDVWEDDKLAECIRLLEANPDAGLVYSDGYIIDEAGSRQYRYMPAGHVERQASEHLLLDCYIKTPSCVVLRRATLEMVGMPREGSIAWDHDFWLRFKEVAKIVYIAKPLIGYRLHSGQLSLNRGMWEHGFSVLSEAKERFNYPSSVVRHRRAVLHFRLAAHDLAERRLGVATWHALKAAMLNPLRAAKELVSRVKVLVSSTRRQSNQGTDGSSE